MSSALKSSSRPISELPLPRVLNVRTFGTFITFSEHSAVASGTTPSAKGKASLRKSTSANGPNTKFAFEEEERQGRVYPGRLHLYDVATGKSTLIVTNEEDSEVLLVDKGTIYYRVNDKLYSSQAGASGLMPGELIATDERIRDAHWAFMK